MAGERNSGADAGRTKATAKDEDQQTWTISGPGAADLLTAQGGLDRPETDPDKGSGSRGELSVTPLVEGKRLAPDLEVPENQKERWIADDVKNESKG